MKKMKLLFVVSLLLLFVSGNYYSTNASDELKDESGNFLYTCNDDGTVTISKYLGSEENVIVPSEIECKQVTYIGNSAFEFNKIIKSVSLPEGLVGIDAYAFAGLGYGYKAYQVKIYIPNSAVKIDDRAFQTISPIAGTYTYPLIVANPDSYAKTFADLYHVPFSCIEHSDVTIYYEEIVPTYDEEGRNAGYFCSVCGQAVSGGEIIPKLERTPPELSETTTTVNTVKAFEKTEQPTTSPQKGSTITSSGSSYKITGTGTNKTVEYSKSPGSKKSLTIPSTVTVDGKKYKVTSVAKNAFKNNKKLKKVTIGSNVTKIGANAFKGCKNLKTVTIKSKKITSFGKNAFKGINAKAKIKVPASKYKKYKKLLNGNNSKKKEKYKVL